MTRLPLASENAFANSFLRLEDNATSIKLPQTIGTSSRLMYARRSTFTWDYSNYLSGTPTNDYLEYTLTSAAGTSLIGNAIVRLRIDGASADYTLYDSVTAKQAGLPYVLFDTPRVIQSTLSPNVLAWRLNFTGSTTIKINAKIYFYTNLSSFSLSYIYGQGASYVL